MRAGLGTGASAHVGFRSGIVGLPNVGKSTLFNALTATSAAQVANFPFCTITPNFGEVPVPDPRLGRIAGIAGSRGSIPARMTFVDIAGLVNGASCGDGLGNRFLANIRETDAILHVLRCFEDSSISHVSGGIDPVGDAETVETELMLADLESIERRRSRAEKRLKAGDRDALRLDVLMQRAADVLAAGRPASETRVAGDEQSDWKSLNLLTAKPVLYVCNVSEGEIAGGNEHVDRVVSMAGARGAGHVTVSAALEDEINRLEPGEAQEFLAAEGFRDSGLARLIRAGYGLLGLETFFTAGPKVARAWTIPKGMPAVEAAGLIHGDFRRGFIRAEVISYDDYVKYGGEQGARDAGRVRTEGRSYAVVDGDVLNVLFNV